MKRYSLLIALLLIFSLVLPASAAPAPETAGYWVPTFNIVSVVTDTSVTISTTNFPAGDTYTVLMGKIGTQGYGGIAVGTQSTGNGTFTATYEIPAALKGLRQIAIRLQSSTTGYYSYNWFYNNTSGATGGPYVPPTYPGYVPVFSIVSVDKDNTVTISASNFTTNDTYTVTMGAMGTRGVGGTVVGTQSSGNGTFTATYSIPDGLKGAYQIALRLYSPTTGYYSYNWFYNNTSGGTGGPVTTPTTPSLPYGVFPTFSISGVVHNSTVTIRTANFPANDTFDVYMGAMGTKGIGGYKVGTFSSGSGGTLTATFNVPAEMSGAYQIAIRLQSPTSGYYAFNWFYNSSTN